jgi:hypothetical protein
MTQLDRDLANGLWIGKLRHYAGVKPKKSTLARPSLRYSLLVE